MANSPRITPAVANSMLDAGIGTTADSGFLRIYDGTQAATASTAIGSQVLLAELTMNADAFPSASSNMLTANSITQDSSANATGTASWFRLVASNGTTVLLDGSVGTSGCDLNLNSVSITAGGTVSCTSFTIVEPIS
jgi:hypothetical protein